MPTQVANREVISLVKSLAQRLNKDLSKADLSDIEPYLESIEEFVGALPDIVIKPKKSSEDNGNKQKGKSVKKGE